MASPLRARQVGSPIGASAAVGPASVGSDSVSLHCLTGGLALMSAVIFSLVGHNEAGHQNSTWLTIEIALEALVVIGGSLVARRFLTGRNSLMVPPLLIVTLLLSALAEPIQRSLFGSGHPMEVVVMRCQANLMLAMATCGFSRAYRQLCAIMSLFLAIFCLTKSTTPTVLTLFACYAVLAVVWLIASHWEQVSRRAIAGSGRRIPLSWLIAIPAVVFIAIGTSGGGSKVINQLRGFFPSSGGVHDHDDYAQGGINDGDGLVAGQDNIQSFGPIEDAPFADDDKPSLYDAFDDRYDDSVKKIKTNDQAIAVPNELLVHIHRRMARSRQAGREFSTLRKNTDRSKRRVGSLESGALFYVAGRVPVHFRLETFDIFDGTDWFPTEADPQPDKLKLTRKGKRYWARLSNSRDISELYSHRETHGIKIVNLKGNVIPSPPQTDAVSIDMVDRLSMYSGLPNGLFKMQRQKLPELTAIQLASNRIDESKLAAGYSVVWVPRGRTIDTSLPVHKDIAAIKQLAHEWTAGLPRGPESINAIVDRLRDEYKLDTEARTNPDSDFPAADFLLRTKRGDEYMFATSAAIMLRGLGYPTRYVGGYYARAEKYQPKKRHTPVHTEDAHVWCEVNIGGDKWITVEPSPGYEILRAPPGLLTQLAEVCVAAALWVGRHPVIAVLTLLLIVATLWNRRRINDAARTLAWTFSRPASNRALALRSLSLLEHRFRLVGMERPRGATFANWVGSLTALTSERTHLVQFAGIANRAAFGSGELESDDRVICEQLVRSLTFGRIRKEHKRTQREERK